MADKKRKKIMKKVDKLVMGAIIGGAVGSVVGAAVTKQASRKKKNVATGMAMPAKKEKKKGIISKLLRLILNGKGK